MDWTIKSVREANHNQEVVVNGRGGKAPLTIDAVVGVPLILDATGTRDPDGDRVTYRWFFYPEAGTGIPGQPVALRGSSAPAAAPAPVAGLGAGAQANAGNAPAPPLTPQEGRPAPAAGPARAAEAGITPGAASSGPREPPPRVTLEHANTARVTVTPHVPGTAHIILAMEDDGTPSLTGYRRVILTIKPEASR